MQKDWRDKLALAIAYRMYSIDGIPVKEAEKQVRDFMKYGPNTENSHAVWVAAVELFGKTLEIVAPAVQIAMRGINETVEREIANGVAVASLKQPTTP